jgi:hypothetical protein
MKDKKLKEMYDKLCWEDKWRIQDYIWREIQYPLMIKVLTEKELLPKDDTIKKESY